MSFGGGDIVVAELHTRIEIVGVEFGCLAQFFEGFLKTLESVV